MGGAFQVSNQFSSEVLDQGEGISISSDSFDICSELGCGGDTLKHNAHASELRAGSPISISRDISLMGSGVGGSSNEFSGGVLFRNDARNDNKQTYYQSFKLYSSSSHQTSSSSSYGTRSSSKTKRNLIRTCSPLETKTDLNLQDISIPAFPFTCNVWSLRELD